MDDDSDNDGVFGDADFDDAETQWTPDARERYRAAAEAAIQLLRRHTELTLARTDDPAEQETYSASAEQLAQALTGLSDAEFDWSGSFPFVLEGVDDEFQTLDDDEVDFPPDGPGSDDGPRASLTVEYRAQLEVLDTDALLAAGRAAYRRAWPEDADDEAEQTVADAATAVAQLIHADGMGSLRTADHLHELWGELSISSNREPAPPRD